MDSALPASNTRGILAMLGGTTSFVVNDAFVKAAGASMPAGEIVAMRGIVSTLLLLLIALWFGAWRAPLQALKLPAFSLRLFGEVGATVAFIVSLLHISFADANGIQQFAPLAITAAAALFLGARVGWRRWLAALAGLAGVLLMVKPFTKGFEPYTIMSASCVGFIVLRDLATRAMPASMPTLLLALTSAAAVMISGFALGLVELWTPMSVTDWMMLIASAVFLVGGYCLVTTAVRAAELAVVVPFRYAGVVVSVLVQLAIWRTLPDVWSLLGMAIVSAAGLYAFHRESVLRASRPPMGSVAVKLLNH